MQNKPQKSNENNFMTILNFIVDPAVIVDEKGHILLVNNAFEDLTGLSKKVIGKAFLEVDLLTPESKAILLKNLRKRIEGFPVEPYEINFTDKAGQARCAEVKAKKIDYVGQSADLVIFRDITRRKENVRRLKEYSEKMEALVNEKVKEIEESEEKYRELINGMNDTAWVIGFDGNFIDVNDAAVRVLGYSREELLRMGPPDIDSSLTKEQIKDLIRSMPADQIQVFETAHTTKDGKTIPVEISSSLVTYQGKQAILSIARDITERKKAQQALVESEEKFKNLAEESPNMVFVNKRGRVVYANKKAEEIMGYTKGEFYSPSFNFLHLIAPESRERIKSVYESHLKNGKDVGPLEFRLITKDGRILDAILTSRLITYEGDKAILGIVTDITERKQLEEDLRSSEEMFRAISTSAMDAIVLMDKTDKIVYWNPAAERMFGYTTEEAVGKESWTLIVPPANREGHLMLLKKLVHQKKQISEKRLDINALRKDGTEFPIELSATALKLKDKTCLLEIIRDVSERKKMEADVQQKLDMLEALTENLGVGLGVISKDYRVVWMNRFIKNNVGEAEGKQCYSAFNTLDHICPDCGVRKVFEEGVAIDSHEYSTIGIHGKPYYVELIATPLKDKDGNVTAALEFVVDIAEKKRMQSELAGYSQKLEQLVAKRTEELKQIQAKLVKSERLATIGELAAMVGHDLRNPLTGIMGAAYYLKTKHGTEVGAKGKEMLETIEKAINYSNKIINDLLEYSRDLKLELTATTPKAMLQSALSLLEVPEKIQIIDITKDKPMVKADTEKIRKVFVNIIQNAVDAMPEGGTLTIKSRKVKDRLKIAFKDTGTGMSEETLSKLKGGVPLFTTKAKGMGFGLPICRRIVEAHGGKLSVKSMAGKGTIVTVTIPVNPEPVGEGEEKWIFSESMLSAITSAKSTVNAKGQG